MKIWQIEDTIRIYASKIAVEIRRMFPFIDSSTAVNMAIAYLDGEAKKNFYSSDFDDWCGEAVEDFKSGFRL